MEYLNLNILSHRGKKRTNCILLSSLSSCIWWHSTHRVTQLENEELSSPPPRSPSIIWLSHPLHWFCHQNYWLSTSIYFYLLLLEALKVASNLPWSSRFHLSPFPFLEQELSLFHPPLILSSCMKQSHCSALDCEIYSNVFYIGQIQYSTEFVGGDILVTYSVNDIHFPHTVTGTFLLL